MRMRQNSEEGSEMEVDGEERKVEIEQGSVDDYDEEMDDAEGAEQSDDDDDEDGDGDEDSNPAAASTKISAPPAENPFLDSFYSLSAADPKDRSRAAQVMLHHCLLGPSANSKDAAYAFRRLLNGLCSGRAAARQGNASALASFLKISFQLEKMNEIRSEAEKNGDNKDSTLLNYVRDRLLSATDPQRTVGKKKGSEERDYHFGRLFGILGVVRSSILLLPGDDDEIMEVASALVTDLVKLFWHRKWMREPAAHGITSMLNLFFGSKGRVSQKIGSHLVREVIIPKILSITQDGQSEESHFQTIIEKYCAEQIGIGAFIQSQTQAKNLPFPLAQPIISTNTLPWISQALSETSVIVQPRTHFVWDTLWCYLTEKPEKEDSLSSTSKCRIRKTIPLGEDRVLDVIDAIMKLVIEEKLLRIEKGTSSAAKTTHERKALALCVVRNLSGAPFVSSISGPTSILMDCDAIENVILTKDVLRSLFFDVIRTGNKKQDASHVLKPLAIEVLRLLVESAVQSNDKDRQLAFLKAITNCDPRFDTRTKTKTISDLLSPSSETVTTAAQSEFWGKYLSYLEDRFLELCSCTEDSLSEAQGYVELIYTCAKHVLHSSGKETENRVAETNNCKKIIVKRVLGFFMSTAFFDCTTVTKPTKNKKGKRGSPANSVVNSAFKVQAKLSEGQTIAYPIRAMVSSRFFSLVSEFAMTVSHESQEGENAKLEKDSNTLAVLEELCEKWNELESKKAKRFLPVKVDDNDDGDSPEGIIKKLFSKVNDLGQDEDSNIDSVLYQSKKRCITGITVLAASLHLHRLTCGTDDEMDDNPDADDEEDEENICSAIEELEGIAGDFFGDDEEGSNPLLGLAEVCANILSSPLGSGDMGRGAAPKLVREAVKYAWLGGLKLASAVATKDKTLLDNNVVGLLMDAIGGSNSSEAAPMDDDDDEHEDDGTEESDGDSDDGMVFSKAHKVLDDPEDMETEDVDKSDRDDDESDIELDPSKLHTMLEDDNLDDVDDIVLEHHEGADAALAKLIKLKQDARKAGQEAREKIEVSNQLRCTILIDLLLGRPDMWNKVFQSNAILEMVIPLLGCQKRVGKLTQRAFETGRNTGIGEKEALLHRITSLIKQKLSKIRISSMPLSSPVDMEAATKVVQSIMKEARSSKDKDYLSCCSSSLIFLLRMMPTSPEMISLVSLEYGNLVRDWSTKRNNGASLLEDLISQMPSLAQASLFNALSRATQDARGFYIKLEAFRLLSLLFANKPNPDESSELQKMAQAKIHESQNDLLAGINKTLNDEEPVKPKLARAIFKAFEKMMPFISSPVSSETLDLMTSIKIEVSGLGGRHADLNVIAEKLSEQIDTRVKLLSTVPATPTGEKTKSKASSSSKKSKKKKKKKLY